MELGRGRVVRESNGVEVEDLIPDDQSILDLMGFGLVVVTGCTHAGILNTLGYVEGLAGRRPMAVIGGTHLTGRSPEYLARTIKGLKGYSLSVFSPSHCTGFKAAAELSAAFPEAFELSYSGRILDFDEVLKKRSSSSLCIKKNDLKGIFICVR